MHPWHITVLSHPRVPVPSTANWGRSQRTHQEAKNSTSTYVELDADAMVPLKVLSVS
jgi:hypothetical protein